MIQLKNKKITEYLSKSSAPVFVIYAVFAALATYSSMYAFRKPFAAATFEYIEIWGISFKIIVIILQSVGYLFSKFYGIKVVSELSKEKRALAIILSITLAWVSLLFFAILPKPANVFAMLTNGFFLGMIWGFVFSYLEGRKFTEILGAGLSVSFIFSSGLVKSIGAFLLVNGVPEMWMPFATGALFFPIMIISVYLLNQIPEPSLIDQELRSKRVEMSSKDRITVIVHFLFPLIFLITAYLLLTTMRDLRDNFATELWTSMGFSNSPELFTLTEIPVSLIILVVLGLLFILRDNFRALMTSHIIIIFGFLVLGLSTYLYSINIISPFLWMVLSGAGLYLGYVPFNSMFFDRMIASFSIVGNVGFLIYLADSIGYLGSLGVLLYKNFGNRDMSYLDFYINSSYFVSIIGIVLVLLSLKTLAYKYTKAKSELKLNNNLIQ